MKKISAVIFALATIAFLIDAFVQARFAALTPPTAGTDHSAAAFISLGFAMLTFFGLLHSTD